MRRSWVTELGWMLTVAAGSAAVFVFTTVSADELPDAAIVGASVFVAFALSALAFGPTRWRTLVAAQRKGLVLAAIGGAAAFWGAPLIVLTQRSTDAPPGAEVAFFTLSVWGVLLAAAALVSERRRRTGGSIAAALAALAGAAGLFASWERPSSFSPFIRYGDRELWMLVAGAVFAAGILALAQAVRSIGSEKTRVISLAGAAAAGLLGMGFVFAQLSAVSSHGWTLMPYLGLAVAITAGAWCRVLGFSTPARSSAALLVAPALLTTLTLVEQATAVYGPMPFDLRGLFSGLAVVIAASAAAWLQPDSAESAESAGMPVLRPARATMVVSMLAVLVSVIALFTPALAAESEGHIVRPFLAQWTMVGAESAAGWLLVAAALLVLAAAVDRADGTGSAIGWASLLVVAGACVAAAPFLASTPMHTWTTWIPGDVQQAYGTEYARFSVKALVDPVRIAAGVSVLVAIGVSVLARPVARRSEEVGS